jgi:hypothetical protein
MSNWGLDKKDNLRFEVFTTVIMKERRLLEYRVFWLL